MIIKKRQRNFKKKEFIKANRNIHVPEVRVLSERGEMIGVMSTRDAQQQAFEAEKDLVLVTENANPPIAKIIDLAKYKYQLQQKQAEGRKKARKQDIKEIRFTPFIGDADFEVRLKKIAKFLERGDKVRITVEFKRGRQMSKQEFGFGTFDRVFAATNEVADIEIQPKMIGPRLMAQISPKKKK